MSKKKAVRHKRIGSKKIKRRSVLPAFFLLGALFFILFLLKTSSPSQKIASNVSRDSMQLETFYPSPSPRPPTPTPPPGVTPPVYVPPPPVDNGTCPPNDWITGGCTCTGNRQIWVYCDDTVPPTPPQPARGCIIMPGADNTMCENIIRDYPNCRLWCEMKPIIYLYPTSPTVVDVVIKTPGDIYISDPTYPAGGWKNILAFPSGKLFYEGKEYKELFYEISHKEVIAPRNGMVIERQNVRSEIKKVLLSYGLNEYEAGEFLTFWIPKLEQLQKPYIQFSIFPKQVKENMDKIVVTPDADTKIEVIAYFKGLDKKIEIDKLILPETPKRNGFVMVAWGGILESK